MHFQLPKRRMSQLVKTLPDWSKEVLAQAELEIKEKKVEREGSETKLDSPKEDSNRLRAAVHCGSHSLLPHPMHAAVYARESTAAEYRRIKQRVVDWDRLFAGVGLNLPQVREST